MNWIRKIDLAGVLRRAEESHDLSCVEERCPEDVAVAIAHELHGEPVLSRYADKVLRASSIAEVNRILEQVYEAADRHRVWCGM